MYKGIDPFQEIGNPTICNQCGKEEKPKGLIAHIKHVEECPKDSPSSDVWSHWEQVKRDKQHAIISAKRDKLKKIATQEEKIKLFRLSMGGFIYGGTVLMGSKAYDAYHDYEKELFDKYNIK